MSAAIESTTETRKTESQTPRSATPEVGFEAALLGSVGKAIGTAALVDPAGMGHGSAPAAPGKRRDDDRETVKRAKAMTDPAAIAASQLATHATPKATTAAAEAQQVTAEPTEPAQPRSRAATGNTRPAQPTQDDRTTKGQPGSSAPESAGRGRAPASEPASAAPAPSGPKRAKEPVTTPKAIAAAHQSKPLDATQALARLAQAISRAADRGATSTPNRSVLRVETARQPQRTPTTKAAVPTSNSNRAQQAQDDFAAQLHRGFSAVLRQSGGSLTMRMQPEALGNLTIRMELQPGQVAAEFEVGTDQARQLLTDQLTSLRSALEARGLSVDKLTVNVSERAAPEALSSRAEPGHSGGAGDGGAKSGNRSGAEHPESARSAPFVVSGPGEGTDVHMGGAQTVRLVLDAVA